MVVVWQLGIIFFFSGLFLIFLTKFLLFQSQGFVSNWMEFVLEELCVCCELYIQECSSLIIDLGGYSCFLQLFPFPPPRPKFLSLILLKMTFRYNHSTSMFCRAHAEHLNCFDITPLLYNKKEKWSKSGFYSSVFIMILNYFLEATV